MQCPNCGLFNPDIASRCDCGYDFQSRRVRDHKAFPRNGQGAIGVFYGLAMASAVGACGSLLSFVGTQAFRGTETTAQLNQYFLSRLVAPHLVGSALGLLPVFLLSGIKGLKPYVAGAATLCGAAWLSAEFAQGLTNHGLNIFSAVGLTVLPPVACGLAAWQALRR